MLIIPAIDIINGKCVRLTKGDYKTSKIYSENPLETAKIYESHGIKNLHLVDLDGAKGKGIVNHKILEEISYKTNLIIDFGGGIKSDEDIKNAFEEMHKNIKEVKNELANMKKELLSESNNFLTVEQVRDKLKVTRATLNNWHKEEILIKRYVGGRVYYKAEEVNNLLNQ